MHYLRWFLKAARPYGWTVAASILCHFALIALTMGYVFVSKTLVDIATGHTESADTLGITDMRTALLAFGAAMIGIIILRDALGGLKTYIQTRASVRLRNDVRQNQFDSLLKLSGDVRGKFHSGDILNRIQDDSSSVATTCCSTIPNLIGTGVQFLAAFAYLLFLESRLAWVLAIVLPAGIFGGKYIMGKMRKLTLEVKRNDSLVQSHVQESVQHQTLIKSLEYDGESSATLASLQDNLYRKSMKRTRFSLLSRILMSLVLGGGYALAFLWGVAGLFHGTVTYGLMTAFLQLVGQLQRPLVQMSDQLPGIFHCTASVDRLNELESLPKEEEGKKIFLKSPAGIRVEHLDFHYEDSDRSIFRDFSHDFTPGSRTAIIGETGAGKTTLIKLMLALENASAGSIVVYDGNSEAKVSGSTRCNLVYVPQGNTLFSGSVRENLLMGNPEASEEQMKEALRTAAADFVLEAPEGLDLQCFEAGGGLSEGQAQRIAIARALLRPGSILLLDEFSSALDEPTEELLLERLTESERSKTMIFITHRRKVSEYCDTILEINQ